MIIPNVAYKKLGGAVPATNGYVVNYIYNHKLNGHIVYIIYLYIYISLYIIYHLVGALEHEWIMTFHILGRIITPTD